MEAVKIIEHRVNPFKGVIVFPGTHPESAEVFEEELELAIEYWHEQGLKSVWLEIPTEKAILIPVAIELGIEFHQGTFVA